FQMLSQFMDIESVFVEVKRVLAPGGIFLFSEEPVKRILSLRLYRCPYYNTMKPWERKLYDNGLLGYLVRDVIGAHQEESFGIRQNHTMGLKDWDRLVQKHFVDHRYELFVPGRGWGESIVKNLAIRLDRHKSAWTAARLLGGTLAAVCRKEGDRLPAATDIEAIHKLLRCPDCRSSLARGDDETLRCGSCGYSAPNEGCVYNLLPSVERKELYPGDREDVIDFSLPGHEKRLLHGWHEVEGIFGNKFRWIEGEASARLLRVNPGPHRLRIRGHAHENSFIRNQPVTLEALVNGRPAAKWILERTGLFILEADVPDAPEYIITIRSAPTWRASGGDTRLLSVNISMLRLVPRD
ncbi:MAG: hypothetical protein ACRD7E_05960, partial [Bryobacteraceae bacterium]